MHFANLGHPIDLVSSGNEFFKIRVELAHDTTDETVSVFILENYKTGKDEARYSIGIDRSFTRELRIINRVQASKEVGLALLGMHAKRARDIRSLHWTQNPAFDDKRVIGEKELSRNIESLPAFLLLLEKGIWIDQFLIPDQEAEALRTLLLISLAEHAPILKYKGRSNNHSIRIGSRVFETSAYISALKQMVSLGLIIPEPLSPGSYETYNLTYRASQYLAKLASLSPVAMGHAVGVINYLERHELEPNLVDLLIDRMEAALNAQYAPQIDDFLAKYDTNKWILASDYSMNNSEFTHDAMAFVLIPYISEMVPPTLIRENLPMDFKRCGRSVDVSSISYLRNAPFFSFVFLLERAQPIFTNVEIAAQAVSKSIEMMKAWPNAHEIQNAETIRKAELCLKEAKTKSFLRKINEVTMLSILGAFVALTATRKRNIEGILWAPDRDNMNGVWDNLSSALFQGNLHSALHRRHMPEKYIHGIAVGGRSGDLWFDEYVRLADFLATPAASMSRQQNTKSNYDKCNQIVQEVFADNPRIIVQKFSFSTLNDQIKPDFRLVRISRNPFPDTSS